MTQCHIPEDVNLQYDTHQWLQNIIKIHNDKQHINKARNTSLVQAAYQADTPEAQRSHTRNIKMLKSKHLKPGFNVVSQLFSVDRNVVLRQPVAVQNWSTKSSSSVHSWEMFQGHNIDVFVCPASLRVFN